MEVTLVIDAQITPASHKSTYQLDIEFTHGDADGDTRRTLFFPEADVQRLKYYLAVQQYIEDNYSDDSGDYIDDRAFDYLNSFMNDVEARALSSRIGDDLYEGDMTCDGQRGAFISGLTVTWWNEVGVQFEVQVTVNIK